MASNFLFYYYFLKCILWYLKLIFNWGMMALQCHIAFFHITAWTSHKYRYILSPLYFSPCHLPQSSLSKLLHSTSLSSLLYIIFLLVVLYLLMDIFVCSSFSRSYPFLPPLCPQIHSLHLSLYSIFLDPIHEPGYTIFVFLLLTFFTLYRSL